MAGSRTQRFIKLMVNTTDVEAKWALQDAATALVQTNLDTHSGTATIHRSINDAGVAVTDLWSASKITTELAGKAATPLVIGDFPDDTITPPKLDIDNAEVDTYVLSYDLGSTSFKWVERVKTDGSNLAAGAVAEAALAIHTAAGAGVDNFAICWDNGNSRLDYMEMMLPDLSNLSVEVAEAVLEVVSHAGALEDGYALAWNNAAGKMEWTDISAIVGADTYKVKWDGADAAEYLGLKLPKPTTGTGYEVYRVNSDYSAIELGAPVNARNLVHNAEMQIDQVYAYSSHTLTMTAAWTAGLSDLAADRFLFGGRQGVADQAVLTAQCNHDVALGTSRGHVHVAVSTPETVVGADEFYYILKQDFSAPDVRNLNGSPVIISFEFLSNAPDGSVFSCAVQNHAKTRTYIFDFTYTTSLTAQLITKTLTMEADTVVGSNPYDLGMTLIIGGYALGATYAVAANAWQAGEFYASNNAALYSWITTAAAYAKVGSVALHQGSIYTPNIQRSRSEYLAQCLPYLCKSYSNSVAVGAATDLGQYTYKNAIAAAATHCFMPVRFPFPMVATPTVALYSPTTGATGNIRNTTAGADVASTAGNVGTGGFGYVDTGATTIGTLHIATWHYLARAALS